MKPFDVFENMPKDNETYQPPEPDPGLDTPLEALLTEKIAHVRRFLSAGSGTTSDLVVHEVQVNGIACAILMCEGLVSTAVFSEILAEPLLALKLEQPTPEALQNWVQTKSLLAPDQQPVKTYGDLFRFMMSGFVVLLIDGLPTANAFGLQGFPGRSVGEPDGERNERSSHEGFNEMLRPNLGMIRRRYKSPDLVFEMFQVGEKSRTDGTLIYSKSSVNPALLEEVRNRLAQIKIDVVLETGYIQPFLDTRPLSIFSGVGFTERPDTICAKVSEGRIAILLDGTPYALLVPYLFSENFQSFDDYSHRPYFATLTRWLKYFSFALSALLPGLYVAMGSFHPELLPGLLLHKLMASEQATPFPLMIEALMIFFLYEVMREAGLRMPKSVGHAVSIVGALVIGDAAVTAGIVGAPMVLIVALTAISSFVVPTLYEPVAFMRFAFILLGGTLGIFGVGLGLCAMLVNLCAVNPLGIPATSASSPFSPYAMRDVLFRWSWRTLAQEELRIGGLTGSELQKGEK